MLYYTKLATGIRELCNTPLVAQTGAMCCEFEVEEDNMIIDYTVSPKWYSQFEITENGIAYRHSFSKMSPEGATFTQFLS